MTLIEAVFLLLFQTNVQQYGTVDGRDPTTSFGVNNDFPAISNIAQFSQDADPDIRAKRDEVVQMFQLAYQGYEKFAWGFDELNPLTKKAVLTSNMFGGRLGATIIDSLDTMYLMGLTESYKDARDWVEKELSFNQDVSISVFEGTIRILGGLLSTFAMTKDPLYLDKAKDFADRLLPAFKSPSAIPFSKINLRTGIPSGNSWGSGSILAEFGSLHLEFVYLSHLLNDTKYAEKVYKIRNKILAADRYRDGLYGVSYDIDKGMFQPVGNYYTMGAMADSFYEYLLKTWLQSGKQDTIARKMYDRAIEGAIKHLLNISREGFYYLTSTRDGRTMEHLACFAGGLFALGAVTQGSRWSANHLEIGKQLTRTCHTAYDRSVTKLGPEVFSFVPGEEAQSASSDPKFYMLRPEVVESYFIMWRLTHNPIYREWGWSVVKALQTHCMTPAGFSGIHDVYSNQSEKDGVQQTFFLAETLKYLYLLFSNDALLDLKSWVFNTEAHPFPSLENFSVPELIPNISRK